MIWMTGQMPELPNQNAGAVEAFQELIDFGCKSPKAKMKVVQFLKEESPFQLVATKEMISGSYKPTERFLNFLAEIRGFAE